VAVDSADVAPTDADVLARCGVADGALTEAARIVLSRRVRGLPAPDSQELALTLRAAGEPHVWPRAWIASGAVERGAMIASLQAWAAPGHGAAARRCGVASGTGADGAQLTVVVAVEALADLAALATRAHAGQWLTVSATMLEPARAARVVVLGPGAEPRSVPSSLSHGRVVARFAPEQPGEYTVQVVADLATGPRPVLEARVFADVDPPASLALPAAPGEEAFETGDGEDALFRAVRIARAEMGKPPLARDPRLDALALAHALRMAQSGELGHDVGDGTPTARLDDAGLSPRVCGENVAHAASVALAHRSLSASPSHRENLLRRDFDRVGLAAARDADGSFWVVELFAGGM
jgi:uncharacterized protein YkwD